jgi:hypothetical protein
MCRQLLANAGPWAGHPLYLAVLAGPAFLCWATIVFLLPETDTRPPWIATMHAILRSSEPDGPCSRLCSIPPALRSHMSAWESWGRISGCVRCQRPERPCRRQDAVLSASASIHQVIPRHRAELASLHGHQPVVRTLIDRPSACGHAVRGNAAASPATPSFARCTTGPTIRSRRDIWRHMPTSWHGGRTIAVSWRAIKCGSCWAFASMLRPPRSGVDTGSEGLAQSLPRIGGGSSDGGAMHTKIGCVFERIRNPEQRTTSPVSAG